MTNLRNNFSGHSTIAIRTLLLILLLNVAGCAKMQKVTDAANAILTKAPGNNLIVNGSFEEPVVPKGGYLLFTLGQSFKGWQVIGAQGNVAPISGEYAQAGIRFNTQDGAQWLDMTGISNTATGVQQIVQTQPGAKYELSFYVGNVSGSIFGTTSTIELLVDGQSIGRYTNDTKIPGQQDWRQMKVEFTASKAATTIAFINRDPPNDNSNGSDNVSLVLATSSAR